MKGEVGAKERTGLTLQNAAKVDAETKVLSARQQGEALKEEAKVNAEVQVFQNAREADVAAAMTDLAMKKAGWDRQAKVAEVEAAKAVAIRDAELQMEIEIKNALCQTEKLKAEQLSKATVQYDTQVQESNALFYGRQKVAEAALYEEMKAAEARKVQADALFFEQKMAEDAKLYAKQREAEALSLVGKAKADYVASMLAALGGDYRALRDYLMIDGGMYAEMARINASAVNGLQPKISVWSNGDGGGEGRWLGCTRCSRRCWRRCTSRPGCSRRRGWAHCPRTAP
uniref:Flotillin-like n=1 Tax=Triticum urartu TaxID=4572 RepID=A0A8R7U2Z5_TRIUA